MLIATTSILTSSFRSLFPTVSARESNTIFAVLASVTSKDMVVEFPYPLLSAGTGSTTDTSLPFAKSQITSPCFFNTLFNVLTSVFANSPMVRMPSEFSFLSEAPPTKNKSRTGSGHIFFSISSGNRVCTRFGFLKSLAIFASSLLLDTPTFTVNPSVWHISSFMVLAAIPGLPNKLSVPVISTNASSMLYCSTCPEYFLKIAINAFELFSYNS